MQNNWESKRDWILFRERIAGWQEAYIGRLNREYIELLTDLCRLVNEGAIGYDDLDGFSEELREDVIRITSYNAHESE